MPMTALFATVAVNPLVVTSPVRFGFVTVPAVVAVVAVAALPSMLPAMVAVTVSAASVPVDVKLDARTFDARVAPVSVNAGAAITVQETLVPFVLSNLSALPA